MKNPKLFTIVHIKNALQFIQSHRHSHSCLVMSTIVFSIGPSKLSSQDKIVKEFREFCGCRKSFKEKCSMKVKTFENSFVHLSIQTQ